MKHFVQLTFVLTLCLLSSFGMGQVPHTAETVALNGKGTYYEVYGSGEPLFLLHGYAQSSKYWLPFVSGFQDKFTVYVVDLQGHGKSDIFDENWTIRSVAENLHDLIEYLELEKIKAIGFSYGGDVLFQLAIIDPELITSMVTIGAVGSWDIKDYPEWVEFVRYANIDKFPQIRSYQHDEAHIRAILDLFKNYVVHLGEDQLRGITANVLIVVGDDDEGIPLAEVDRIRKNLPSSDLWILPDSPHAVQDKHVTEFLRIAVMFLGSE